jgi:hypothetical protein
MTTGLIEAGAKFGRMTVLRCVGVNKHRARRYECRCDCGTVKVVNGGDLKSGRVLSCSCLKRERSSEASSGESNARYVHGGSGTKLHRLWQGMQERCECPKHISYQYYGKRGISVCLAWKTFDEFRRWAKEHGYQDGLSIDRINPDAGYEPDNCRIVTRSENTAEANRRRKGHKR